ncbi:MAG TPA: class IV adenylate cyclase [Gemmatimonadales bacterium]|nr:class IV adenylate cyclase [Gemmatimonadales bacterium]
MEPRPAGEPRPEHELKAVVPDPDAVRRRLLAAGAGRGFQGRMLDRRYDRDGELAARDEVLRVRTYLPAHGPATHYLAWKGPTERSPGGYKLRRELEYEVSGEAPPAALLEALGYRAVHAIDRYVETFTLRGATLRLERYPRMDLLLEVEGDPAAIEAAIAATGIPRDEFLPDALTAFVARFEARTGTAAVLAEPEAAGPAPPRFEGGRP